MNRDAKTQSALLALARTRRMQRAVAHAYLYREAPSATMRMSLGFMMQTACTTDEVAAPAALGHRMCVLGVANAEGVAYVVEELEAGEAPIAYRLFLRGPRTGHLVPIAAWYERDPDEHEIRARLAAIATTLEPCMPVTREAWMLSTRVVQRRALRIATQGDVPTTEQRPIRKFALQLKVDPVSGHGATGVATVTAFLRPTAELIEVVAVPGEPGAAIARVGFVGIPSGAGLTKETVVLLYE